MFLFFSRVINKSHIAGKNIVAGNKNKKGYIDGR
jgi:hypothetical protein